MRAVDMSFAWSNQQHRGVEEYGTKFESRRDQPAACDWSHGKVPVFRGEGSLLYGTVVLWTLCMYCASLIDNNMALRDGAM